MIVFNRADTHDAESYTAFMVEFKKSLVSKGFLGTIYEIDSDQPNSENEFLRVVTEKNGSAPQPIIIVSGHMMKSIEGVCGVALIGAIFGHALSHIATDQDTSQETQVIIDSAYKLTGVNGVDRSKIITCQSKADPNDMTVIEDSSDKIKF